MEYAVYWLIALVVLLVIEAATLGLATIWFAGGALIALIAAMCGAGFVIQMVADTSDFYTSCSRPFPE